MENQITVFSNEQFGQVRTVMVNNEPYFSLSDVCKVLEIKNSRDAKTRLSIKGVVTTDTLTNGGVQQMDFINEANLYKLIFQSRKAEAQAFADWVTEEVLPSIRKTGKYELQQDSYMIDDPIERARRWADEQEAHKLALAEKQRVIEEQKPKVEYHDEVLNSEGLFTVTQIAKDFGLTAVKLNNILHSLGIQYKQSGQWLLYSEYLDKGYAHSQTVTYGEDSKYSKMNTKWTNKGRKFIWELLKKNGLNPIGEEAKDYLNEVSI